MSERKWICEGCGTGYAEYVNGCPKCSDGGLNFSVREAPAPAQPTAAQIASIGYPPRLKHNHQRAVSDTCPDCLAEKSQPTDTGPFNKYEDVEPAQPVAADTPEMNETVLSIKHKLEAVAVNAFVVGLDYLSIAKQAVSDHQKGLEHPAQPVASPLCGKVVTHLIAGSSWFTCALPKGHAEEGHRAEGNCFKHGKYLGTPGAPPQCPKWPDCIPRVEAPARSQPACAGYPVCDGDLPGEPHEKECPAYQPVASPELEWCNRCQRNVTGYHECYDVRCTESPASASPHPAEQDAKCRQCGATYGSGWAGTTCLRCDGDIEVPSAVAYPEAEEIARKHFPETYTTDDKWKSVDLNYTEREQCVAAIRDYAASLEARLAEDHHERRQAELALKNEEWRRKRAEARAEKAEAERDELKSQPRFNEKKHIERMVAAGCAIDFDPETLDLIVTNERAEALAASLRDVGETLTKIRPVLHLLHAHPGITIEPMTGCQNPTCVELSALLTRLSTDTKEEK